MTEIDMLLDTLIDFFKLNEAVMGSFIQACHNVASLPEDRPAGILFDDVVGMMYSDTAMLIPEISCSVLALKKLCLKYLISILESFSGNGKSFRVHIVSLAAMIDKFIRSSDDKSLMASVLMTADFIKQSVDDQFFVQELDKYLDDNLFDKYYNEDVLKQTDVNANMSVSRVQSVERWKILRSVSLRSPTKSMTKSPTRMPSPDIHARLVQEQSIEEGENSSLQTSQFMVGNAVVDFNIQEVICDGKNG